jgi:hypothetical protein
MGEILLLECPPVPADRNVCNVLAAGDQTRQATAMLFVLVGGGRAYLVDPFRYRRRWACFNMQRRGRVFFACFSNIRVEPKG